MQEDLRRTQAMQEDFYKTKDTLEDVYLTNYCMHVPKDSCERPCLRGQQVCQKDSTTGPSRMEEIIKILGLKEREYAAVDKRGPEAI